MYIISGLKPYIMRSKNKPCQYATAAILTDICCSM